ncbi:MAG: Gldg family protein [Clostridia bacterium]|nr:Gldg family protein [Clostridia bacterium]
MKKRWKRLLSSRAGGWIAAALILLLVAANVGLAWLTTTRAFYPDMTPEGLYSVSDEMYRVCESIGTPVTITFCDEPDRLLGAVETRYVYILAQHLAARFDNIRVETADATRNPTALYRFRTTAASSIAPTDVIISCEGRYRIMAARSFFTVSSEDGQTRYWSFDGEYKLANALLSVSAVDTPLVCFSVGHGETFFVSPDDADNAALRAESDEGMRAFYQLLSDEGLTVGYIDPETEPIPDECVLLIICDPAEDFEAPDPRRLADGCALDRIHTYLSQRTGALMVFKSPDLTLPNLEELVSQWGIEYARGVVAEDTGSSLSDPQALIAVYNTEQTELSHSVYADVSDIAGPPRTVTPHSGTVAMSWKSHEAAVSSTTNVTAYSSPFFYTSERAMLRNVDDGTLASASPARYATAQLATRVRMDGSTGLQTYSYVFASASVEWVRGEWLEQTALGNRDVLFALVRYISRTDRFAPLSLGGSSLASSRMGGRVLDYGDLSATAWTYRAEDGSKTVYRGLTASARTAWTVALITAGPAICLAAGGAVQARRRRR